MRQRITFFHRPGSSVDPALLRINGTALSGPEIVAAREDKITFALDELPSELRKVLADSREFHIRWVSPQAHEPVEPLHSRVSPGFHLFYTPLSTTDLTLPHLCVVLAKIFGAVDCSTPEASFTALPNDRFSHSTASQYYQQLENLNGLAEYAASELCPAGDAACAGRIAQLRHATSLDVSYDTISHALRVTAVWPHGRQPLQITSHPGYRTEVGILGPNKPPNLEPYEIGISGHLTVLGQDKTPSQTAFAISSRHRNAESAFSTTFLEPTGLHPAMQLRLASNRPPVEDAYCSAHAYLTLPRTIFADRYQLGDDLFLASKNLTVLRYMTQPVDLEAPEYTTAPWGSAVLLELSPPKGEQPEPWTAEIPLHLRYLAPGVGGYRAIEIPYPAVFWACASEEGTKFPTNPFDRVNLGYDGLFGPRTVFWHVDPHPEVGARLANSITVPVLDTEQAAWVNVGTAAVAFLGFAWVVFRLVVAFLRTGYIHDEPVSSEIPSKEKKEQ